MRRKRPTLLQLDELEEKLRLELENVEHFKECWLILDKVRTRFQAAIAKEILAAHGPDLDIDEVEHAALVGAPAAIKGRFRSIDLDGSSLGRGGGAIYEVLRVGDHTYPIRRRPS